MNNIRLQKSSKGWILIVEDEHTRGTIALTSLELWTIGKMIKDYEKKLIKEIEAS